MNDWTIADKSTYRRKYSELMDRYRAELDDRLKQCCQTEPIVRHAREAHTDEHGEVDEVSWLKQSVVLLVQQNRFYQKQVEELLKTSHGEF